MRILLEGPILTQSGYGEQTRLVFDSLSSLNDDAVQIFTNPLEWGKTSWTNLLDLDLKQRIHESITLFSEEVKKSNGRPEFDLHVHVGILNEFQKKAKRSVHVTAGIETNVVSAEWIKKTYENPPDKIIFTSEHSRKVFQDTKILVKTHAGKEMVFVCNEQLIGNMHVVGHPVKDVVIEDLPLSISTKFNFLSICLDSPRKNIENLIKWFMLEFKENADVGLILKTGQVSGSIIDRNKTIEKLKNILSQFNDSKCKVYLLHGDLKEEQIHSLYLRKDIHAYVTATCGEGYGLPIFEAAYYGMPVVATNWSGHLDFLSAPMKERGKLKVKKLFAKLDFDLVEVPDQFVWPGVISKGSKWANVKESSLRTQLRKVYQNYGMYRKWAETLKVWLHQEYSQQNIHQLMSKFILEQPIVTKNEKNMDIISI